MKKKTLGAVLKTLMLTNPELSNVEISRQTGASTRAVTYARAALRNEGRSSNSRKTQSLPPHSEATELTPEAIEKLSSSENIELEIGDSTTRALIVRSVQRMALDPRLHPDTRLSASQIWVKLKDLARTTELGPGPPRTQQEIIDRLLRIFKAVGHPTVLKALEIFTEKELSHETSEIEQTPTLEGTQENTY